MRQELVIEALKSRGPMIPRQILDACGIPYSYVAIYRCNECLRSLKKYDIVRKVGEVGKGRNIAFVWELVE